jgi:hypothetical protein
MLSCPKLLRNTVDVLHDGEDPLFLCGDGRQPKFMSFKISRNTREIRAFMLIKV